MSPFLIFGLLSKDLIRSPPLVRTRLRCPSDEFDTARDATNYKSRSREGRETTMDSDQRDMRLKVDPDGTLWLDVQERDDHAAGAEMELIQGSDPDDEVRSIPLSQRDFAEMARMIDLDPVSDGHKR